MAVPLILTQPASEFGDFVDTAGFNDPQVMDRDMSYVPGFSNLRRERDLKIAEYTNHRITRAEIPTLPVNVRWGRSQKGTGVPDSTKVFGHSLNGYRMVTKDDLPTGGTAKNGYADGKPKHEWLTAIPPGAEIGADGTIRKGDTVLMVATKERAAQNAHRKAQLTSERVTGMQHGFAAQASADRAGWKGADPSATKEPLSTINVPVAQAAGK